jgi:hypothetical protein
MDKSGQRWKDSVMGYRRALTSIFLVKYARADKEHV